ncbi:MAG: PHP domain-containing protein, partial [Acutalibacteraceae bacterium]|nr:PHP domain-containing protein [Acutalibacteraceae bacterium]
MAKALFSDIFGANIPSSDSVQNCIVEHCGLDLEERTLNITLKSENYITITERSALNSALSSALKLNSCEIGFIYGENALDRNACADIVAELRLKNAALNGYFNGAEFNLTDNNIGITLKYGGFEKIKESGFENAFRLIIKERFGKEITVSFDGQLDAVEMEIPKAAAPEHTERKQAPKADKPSAPKKEIKFEKRQEKPENGIVYLDNPQTFYGRGINTNTKKMIEVTPDDTEISCWGEVFGTEVRKINTKRGESNILTFSFSDYTNSLTASMFIDPKRMGEVAPIKDGAFVLINGTYEFDNYKSEFRVKPKAMALLQKYEETDSHEGEKRVELHCHTNMSAKDAVSSAADIINRAYKWGHKAVAITDHGVVQAYPAAAGAVKSIRKGGGEFKVIYGVEAYFVDDINNDITGLNAKQLAKYRCHQIILVKNLTGLKNLYQLVSDAHLNNFKGKPITLRSKLDTLREGLIIGSACEQGELYKAIVDERPEEELLRIADYY